MVTLSVQSATLGKLIVRVSGVVLLDTHVWVWLALGDERLRKAGLLPLIKKHAKTSSVQIPAISLWEVAMLASKNRISIAGTVIEWLNNAIAMPGLSVHPITPEIACDSVALPGDFHGDPADRLIVATARITDSILLTVDKKILAYGKQGFVNVFSVKK